MDELGATIANGSWRGPALVRGLEAPPAPRTTVLPRVELVGKEPRLTATQAARYENVGQLGEGAMGEVSRVVDRDIGRTVAMKRLKDEVVSPASLARFVEEIRVIGQLEHPNIVPIHDVGLDEQGQYFFMMKYVEGETLETILERLRAGDAEAHRRYSVEKRLDIFMGLLDAMAFAHAKGIIHRDLKPANIMVGPFGEVMVMDWGLAKKIRGGDGEPHDLDGLPRASASAPDRPATRADLFRTRDGTLIGTPAYMSPEQALGNTDEIDERSDTYALCIILHELLTLEHYLSEKKNAVEMLIGVANEEVPGSRWARTHPAQKTLHVPWIQYVQRGVGKGKAQRFQSVAQMREQAQRILEGRCPVMCHVSLVKRGIGELGHLVDRFPEVGVPVFILGLLATVFFAIRGILAP